MQSLVCLLSTNDSSLDLSNIVYVESLHRDNLSPEVISDIISLNLSVLIVSTGSHWRRNEAPLLPVGIAWQSMSEIEARAYLRTAIDARFKAFETLPDTLEIIWRTPDVSHWSIPYDNIPLTYNCGASSTDIFNDVFQI